MERDEDSRRRTNINPSFRVGPIRPTFDLLKSPASPPSPAAVRFADALHPAEVGAVPDSPPAEVQRQVDEAARRYERLRENGRELRFDWNKADHRVHVEVRDLNGRLLREIPPSAALDAMSVGPFEWSGWS